MTVQAGVEGGNSQGQSGNAVQDNSQNTQQQADSGQQQTQQNSGAPYAQHLERLPESVRPLVEPVFREWDTNVNQRFQQLHSQYAWAQPYQELAQQGYDHETISQGLQLLQALSDNPQGLYEAIGNAYGITPQQAQQIVQQGQQEPDDGQQQYGQLPPEFQQQFQQYQQTVDTIANILMEQRQQDQETQEEQQFYQMLDGLKQQHGEFDQDYVIAKIAAGMDPNQAVMSYRQLVQGQAQQLNNPGQQAPVVMGSGGGQPTTTVPVTQLSKKDRTQLVASLLSAGQQQQG